MLDKTVPFVMDMSKQKTVQYQLPLILTTLLHVGPINDAYLSHSMCNYQVIMTLHFLNDVANNFESILKSIITS